MKKSIRLICALIIPVLIGIQCKNDMPSQNSPPPPPPPSNAAFTDDNVQVVAIVAAISADSIRAHVEKLISFETRHTISDTVSTTRGIGAARRWIHSKFSAISQNNGGRLQVSYDDFTDSICDERRLHRNVVAVLPGTTTPEQQILVSGHYDSRTSGRCDNTSQANGANDDGSGTAGVIELARVLSPHQFKSTLVFVAFTGEEQGLFGSRSYAFAARQRGDDIIAMVTNDVIGNVIGGSGTIDSTRVRCFSDDPNESPHRQLARYVKLQGEAYQSGFLVDLILARDRPGRGGDHFAFNEHGYTAIRLTEPEDNLNHQHNPNDLIEFMDFDYCQRVVRVDAAFLASLADAPKTPSDLTASRNPDGSYTLTWDADTQTSYIVALRSNTSAMYDTLIAADEAEFQVPAVTATTWASVAAVGSNDAESLFTTAVLLSP